MPLIALILLVSCSASAQLLPWIDLSGEWRVCLGDEPRFAEPGFDDGGCGTVRLPGTIPVAPDGYYWVRRSVSLPDGVDRAGLVLTLGNLTENYEVFVNGRRIWSSGFTARETQLARPRMFGLPLLEDGPVHIAIRGWRHRFFGSGGSGPLHDSGPYLITAVPNAPAGAGEAYLHHLRMRRTPDLAAGALLLTLSVILLLMFGRDLSRKELLWLAVVCALVGWSRLRVVLSITPDSTPFDAFTPRVWWFAVPFLEFSMAAVARGSWAIRGLAWPAVLGGLLFRPLLAPARVFVNLLSIFVLVRSLAHRSQRTTERFLVVAGGLAVIVAETRSMILPGPGGGGFFSGHFRVGPYETNLYPIVLAVYAFVMVTLLIRRLLLDREQKQRLAGELEAARIVQQLLLPSAHPAGGAYEIDAVYEPAQEVGGDFYYAGERGDGSRVVVVGDVSGKGLKAAMVVSFTLGVLDREETSSPAGLLAAMNTAFQGRLGGGAFVTCCCLRLEPEGRVTVASAGHPMPYRDGQEIGTEPGLPLGIVRNSEWLEQSIALLPGDQLTIVSDGVVEAQDVSGELFGFDRSRRISTGCARAIASAAQAWGQNDDITVVTVRKG